MTADDALFNPLPTVPLAITTPAPVTPLAWMDASLVTRAGVRHQHASRLALDHRRGGPGRDRSRTVPLPSKYVPYPALAPVTVPALVKVPVAPNTTPARPPPMVPAASLVTVPPPFQEHRGAAGRGRDFDLAEIVDRIAAGLPQHRPGQQLVRPGMRRGRRAVHQLRIVQHDRRDRVLRVRQGVAADGRVQRQHPNGAALASSRPAPGPAQPSRRPARRVRARTRWAGSACWFGRW